MTLSKEDLVKMLQDVCWAMEVVRDRLPDDDKLTPSETVAILIHEKAIQALEGLK